MNKKALCGLLTTALLFGTCPSAAMAAPLEPTGLTTITESLDFRNKTTDETGTGYSWDADSLTLTLENFRIKATGSTLDGKAAIYLPEESIIDIEGDENVILTESYHCDAIHCEGELWFEDDGKLEIIVKNYGSNAIYAEKGPVIFHDEVEITVDPGRTIIYVNNASGNHPIVSFQDEAKMIFPEEDANERSVLLIKKSNTSTGANWFDFAEQEDEWDDDMINLVAKDAVAADKEDVPSKEEATPPAEAPSEEPAKQSTYEITIGNAAIKKDGVVTYVSDAVPYLSHGYTMLPLRALLNVTNADVELTWDAATKTVSVKQNTDSQYFKNAVIPVGETYFLCGNDRTALSTPAELKNGRAFISLRDWMNILADLDMPASDLSWNSKTKTVTFVK